MLYMKRALYVCIILLTGVVWMAKLSKNPAVREFINNTFNMKQGSTYS